MEGEGRCGKVTLIKSCQRLRRSEEREGVKSSVCTADYHFIETDVIARLWSVSCQQLKQEEEAEGGEATEEEEEEAGEAEAK